MPDPLPSVDAAVEMLALALAMKYHVRPLIVSVETEGGKVPFSWNVAEISRGTVYPFMSQVYESRLPAQQPIMQPKSETPRQSTAENPDTPPDEEPLDERRRGLAPCLLDILATLRDVGEPLTKIRLQEEMEKRQRLWGERTVDHYLKVLMEDGVIDNPKDARPRGYRLPEWEEKD